MQPSLVARRSMAATLAALIALTVLAVAPATAIKYGELDNGRHPFVGLMVAQDDERNPMWRCSGALISPTLFLTAGHCTEAPTAHVEIWFDDDVTDAQAHNYPFVGEVSGTPYTHPDYNPNAFYLRDLGMVVLEEPYPLAEYGTLPTLDQLDALTTRRGKQNVTFRAVGYGLQWINPVFVESARVRMVAYPKLNQINAPGFTGDYSLLLSNNRSTGGTCFGDSGGPNFLGSTYTIAGVTSFAINGNCAGTGGVFRIDRSWSLNWINDFLSGELP
jgi:secreted trypsin-like serine protease